MSFQRCAPRAGAVAAAVRHRWDAALRARPGSTAQRCTSAPAVHGIEADVSRRPIAPAGRTDREITRAILLDAGVGATQIDDGADAVQGGVPRLCAAVPRGSVAHRAHRDSRSCWRAVAARGSNARARDRQLRGDRAAEAQARRDRPLVRCRRSARSAPTPRTAPSCRRSLAAAPVGRSAVPARADDRDRRHAARRRLRPRRRGAVRRGCNGTVRGRRAARRGASVVEAGIPFQSFADRRCVLLPNVVNPTGGLRTRGGQYDSSRYVFNMAVDPSPLVLVAIGIDGRQVLIVSGPIRTFGSRSTVPGSSALVSTAFSTRIFSLPNIKRILRKCLFTIRIECCPKRRIFSQ